MAKALIIKNADFSANKVTTITFGSIPCAGITFSQDTYTITGYTPVEVEYTLTPNDTTDEVEWASSDNNVVTASGGVLTIVGIGTATITATCGEYSATATITVNITCSYKFHGGYYASISDLTPPIVNMTTSASRCVICGDGDVATQYFANAPFVGAYAIKLPKNTAKVKIEFTSTALLYNGISSFVLWAKDQNAGSTLYQNMITPKTQSDSYDPRTTGVKTFDVPDDGTDAMFFIFRLNATPESWDTAMTALGLSISFLTE